MAGSCGRANQPDSHSQRLLGYPLPCDHPGVRCCPPDEPAAPGGRSVPWHPLPAQRCRLCRAHTGHAGCCCLCRAPLSSQGARNRSFFYPRKLKTTMIVYLKNSVLFALRNASIEPLLLPSPLALPILLLPLLCCSVSYHFLLPTLPGDCARHGLKIKSFQRRNVFATMEADVNKTQ